MTGGLLELGEIRRLGERVLIVSGDALVVREP